MSGVIFMHLCVKNCSDNLIKHFLSEGHTLSDETYADAVVYDNCSIDEIDVSGRQNGVFLVNAHGKSDDEIDLILKNRLYSPIFFG